MEFTESKPIYRQIGEWMEDKILRGEWPESERIPSVREVAMTLQVNPNTAMRAYDDLQGEDILFNRRGIGFFTAEGARERILARQRNDFRRDTLPALFARMQLLGITPGELTELFEKHKTKHDENEQ